MQLTSNLTVANKLVINRTHPPQNSSHSKLCDHFFSMYTWKKCYLAVHQDSENIHTSSPAITFGRLSPCQYLHFPESLSH